MDAYFVKGVVQGTRTRAIYFHLHHVVCITTSSMIQNIILKTFCIPQEIVVE